MFNRAEAKEKQEKKNDVLSVSLKSFFIAYCQTELNGHREKWLN